VELAEWIARGDDSTTSSTCGSHESAIARLPGARLVPLGGFADAIPTLDRARDIVVHCRSGARSARAVRQLQLAGFTRAWNLAGGILRWSDDVDASVAKYGETRRWSAPYRSGTRTA
jgi:adenylyltransferase/sulfurtransferase